MTVVLDASAVLALIWDEPGAEAVEDMLGSLDLGSDLSGYISAVNATEVIEQLGAVPSLFGGPTADVAGVPYDLEHAEIAAGMLTATRPGGLSLADRACLALAKSMSLPAVTADRAWSDVDVGVEVIQIR